MKENIYSWVTLEDCKWLFPYWENCTIAENMAKSNPRDVRFENGIVTSYRGYEFVADERTNAFVNRSSIISQLLENVGILPMPKWELMELREFYNSKPNSWLELKVLEVFEEHVNVLNDEEFHSKFY